jgi:hypothetical protein
MTVSRETAAAREALRAFRLPGHVVYRVVQHGSELGRSRVAPAALLLSILSPKFEDRFRRSILHNNAFPIHAAEYTTTCAAFG